MQANNILILNGQDQAVKTLFDQFTKGLKYLRNLSERTILSYKDAFDRWLKFVGAMPTEKNHVPSAVRILLAKSPNKELMHFTQIGIGRDLTAPPSHTTVHTVPYTAVRTIMLFSAQIISEVRLR
jgi:hypothetical protein